MHNDPPLLYDNDEHIVALKLRLKVLDEEIENDKISKRPSFETMRADWYQYKHLQARMTEARAVRAEADPLQRSSSTGRT